MEVNVPDDSDLEPMEIDRIVTEELFRGSVRTMNTWREILDRAGWRNTGEGIGSIVVEPQREGAFAYTIGSEKIQIRIAEDGRAPGSKMPPHEPIADWVHEQADMLNRGEQTTVTFGGEEQTLTFDGLVFLVRRSIARHGIEPIKAGQQAMAQEGPEIQRRIDERLEP